MAKLDTAQRKALPDSAFAGPGRSYPVENGSHAANAKARATQQENAGNLSHSEAAHIRARANAVLGKNHAELADRHLSMHAHHLAISEHHEKNGEHELAKLHHGMAAHHMKAAEAHHNIAEAHEGYEGSPADNAQDKREAAKRGMTMSQYEGSAADRKADEAGQRKMDRGDVLAKGAATQLHRKGYISKQHHDRIHKQASKPFGSLAGAGHYMGDVDEANSAGTNAGM